MDEVQRCFYQREFKIAFLEKQGQAFEDMFSGIMGHAFPEDFQPVRPYGNKGDMKCDGYRASDKTVFQCYAPRTMKLAALKAKIDTDFNGAVDHWGSRHRHSPTGGQVGEGHNRSIVIAETPPFGGGV